MSFSAQTKNELSRLPIEDRCCALAELSAMVRMNATIEISSDDKMKLKFVTENAAIARRTFTLLKILYDTCVEVMVRKNRQLKKNNSYVVYIRDSAFTEKVLKEVGFKLDTSSNYFITEYSVPDSLIENRCCRRAYLRGSFLGSGSISNPEKAYHIEFVANTEEYALSLSEIINSFELNSKIIKRKDSFVIYIKEGEQLVDLLNIMGAHQALLKFEDIRVLKDVRNNINRLVNCETANLSKTIDASVRQVENIEYIRDRVGLDKLPKNLEEIALARLENRDASLKELGTKVNPPVGKSGVNHRLRRIEDFAVSLRKKGGEDIGNIRGFGK